jgi:diguanylate cyclase (GGDEF)-like protein
LGARDLKNTEDMVYSKYRRYEMIFINITWAYLIFTSLIYFIKNIFYVKPSFINDPEQSITLILSIGICAACFLGNLFKRYLFNAGILENKTIFLTEKLISLLEISLIIIFTNIGMWLILIILMPIMITCLIRGLKPGLFLLASSFVIHTSLFLLNNLIGLTNGGLQPTVLFNKLLSFIIYYAMFLLFVILFGLIYKDGIEHDIENKNLMEQLEEKYQQLEAARDEIKVQYEELKSTNSKLEKSNKKLSDSIGEFYTLQQISQAISSILDIKELLKHLNDIIIGVMGVSYSTIILYDEKTNRLKVHTSNISNANDMATMKDNINNGVLLNALNNGENIMENYVDPVQYLFTLGRDVNSLICLPLNTKTRKFGLVLVEHTYSNAFDEDNLRLLNIISKQVGIVMENAELYNKMTELARKDGLTGIFNRQYFQERLEVEFCNAKRENYPLSLAIFDIDHFKKFNDTFGHMFGDKVLISIVETVSSTLRKNDIIARFGGEEFIILFPRTSLQEAYDKVEALREHISQHMIKDNLITASVTASFGVSSFDECTLTESELVKTADDALYVAKEEGRNCVRMSKILRVH